MKADFFGKGLLHIPVLAGNSQRVNVALLLVNELTAIKFLKARACREDEICRGQD